MNKLITAAACTMFLATAPVFAQSPRAEQRTAPDADKRAVDKDSAFAKNGPSMSEMTPEMWLYTQEMHRREDPKEAVRRKAEFRTAQRQRRMAAREWFGYSNARPAVNPDPFSGGSYSAHWSANNAMRPDQWIGNSRAAVRR
ncbi:MAG TPA: hypothetical protein VHC22_01395 [Pirellulales bacterium]|nr:hypothetical protein [Pirellulales bacterium]